MTTKWRISPTRFDLPVRLGRAVPARDICSVDNGASTTLTLLARIAAVPIACALAVVMFFLVGCQSPAPTYSSNLPGVPPVPPSPTGPGAANYATNVLAEGDVVGITFQFSTNYNTTQKIGIDGTVTLESAGPVKAAGKTPEVLQNDVAQAYGPKVKGDVVTVKLLSPAATVYVCGAVVRPGKVPLDHPMTVLEAVIEAGGFDQYRAQLSATTVLRIKDGREVSYPVNLKHVLQGNDPTPFYLEPSDIIYVPARVFNF